MAGHVHLRWDAYSSEMGFLWRAVTVSCPAPGDQSDHVTQPTAQLYWPRLGSFRQSPLVAGRLRESDVHVVVGEQHVEFSCRTVL